MALLELPEIPRSVSLRSTVSSIIISSFICNCMICIISQTARCEGEDSTLLSVMRDFIGMIQLVHSSVRYGEYNKGSSLINA